MTYFNIDIFFQIGPHRIHLVRTRGGNRKFRALRLDHGNFAWASESEFKFIFFDHLHISSVHNYVFSMAIFVQYCA